MVPAGRALRLDNDGTVVFTGSRPLDPGDLAAVLHDDDDQCPAVAMRFSKEVVGSSEVFSPKYELGCPEGQ